MLYSRIAFFWLALAAVGCDGKSRPSHSSVALEFAFEGTLEPAAWVDVGHAATPTGVAFESGADGRAAHFDGSGASVDVTGVDALPLSSALTVELFVKADDWKNPYAQSAPVASVVSHSDDFTIAIMPLSWTYRATVHTSEGNVDLNGGAVRLGSWQHVALVYDSEEKMARLYVDGAVVDQREALGKFTLQPGIPVRVGTWFKQNQAFRGAVDSLRIWDRALAPSEVTDRAGTLRSKRREVAGDVKASLDRSRLQAGAR